MIFATLPSSQVRSGGQGIRTLEELAPLAVFKTAALGRYASPPGWPTVCRIAELGGNA